MLKTILLLAVIAFSQHFYGAYKIGDQPRVGGTKDGMPICAIDTTDWGNKTITEILSPRTRKIFLWIKYTISKLEAFKASLLPSGTLGDSTFRARSKKIIVSEIEKVSKISGLEADLRNGDINKNPISIVDGTSFDDSLFKVSTVKTANFIDRLAISSGTYLIGSGEAYATVALALSDLEDLDGNLTLKVSDDVTETGGNVITEDLNGNTLRITSDDPHNGDPTAGHLISNLWTGGQNWIEVSLTATGGGTLEIDNLHLKQTGTQSTSFRTIQIFGLPAFDLEVHDILADGNGGEGANFIIIADVDITVKMWNVVVWDYSRIAYWLGFATNSSNISENLIAYNCQTGLDGGNKAQTVQNVVCVGNTTDFVNLTNLTIDYCASEDGTEAGANSVTITAASEFTSLSDVSASFFEVVVGSLEVAGVSPSIVANTIGIRGDERPGTDGFISMGADEFTITVAPTTSILKFRRFPMQNEFKQIMKNVY